jgi:citrate synthase
MSTAVVGKGLGGVVAANSGICWINGDAGVLAYHGIDIRELAEKSTFEETTYLLWFGQLPSAWELKDWWRPANRIWCRSSFQDQRRN